VRTKLRIFLVLLSVLISGNVTFISAQPAHATMPSSNLLLDLRANNSSSYGGSGSTWTDLSGNGLNATLQGSPTWSSANGGQFAMDGTDHFTLPSGFANFSTGISISIRANFGSNSNTRVWERLLDFGRGMALDNFLFTRVGDSNDLGFEIYQGGTSRGICTASGAISPADTWATYGVTLSGTTCTIYKNGSWIHSTTYNWLPSNVTRNINYIGRSNWGSDAYFDSGISAVAIWNRSLSTAEMETAHRRQIDSTAPTITGPSSATGASSAISIAENSTAVHTFTANETVTWSKSGTDESFFSIASAGGVLTITARDFESPVDNGNNNTYIVTITATDSAGNATNQTLTVTITNVNEAPTITTASSNPTHTITQAENISSVVTYRGSDVDAGTTLTWSISGTDSADFSINSSSGALAFAANPDFEAPADSDTNNAYIVVVTLSDGALTDTQTVTITITNANETASINAPTVSGTINKGVNTTITVTINVAGKVRFFVGNKRISTCKERTTSGTYPNNTATCTWKPAVTGRQILTATLTPTDNTFSPSTSAATTVQVVRRNSTR
jgi:VCBS repeat-containing protein